MNKEEVKALMDKYANGQCTAEEIALLETWYSQYNEQKEIDLNRPQLENATDRVWDRLEITTAETSKLFNWKIYAAAASVLLCLSIGGFFYIHHKLNNQQLAQNLPLDIAPGTNHALLKIGNGKTVLLDYAAKGLIEKQGNTSIDKTGDGLVSKFLIHQYVRNEYRI